MKLETDIDDCSGEVLGYVMKKLFKAGAKDVHYAPVFMKKNRPAWELTVICGEEKAEELEKIIFTETTTIGIREYPLGRSVLSGNGLRQSICEAGVSGKDDASLSRIRYREKTGEEK